MRVAIAAEGTNVSAHFGHCDGFMVYEVENGEASEGTMIPNPGHRPGFLPVFLKENNVELVIAGGMGERAQTLFADNGIESIVGAQGRCDDVVAQYLKGGLVSTGEACKEHSHAHECGEH